MPKRSRDGLDSKVLKAQGLIQRDEKGFYYLPMCHYEHHVGVVEDEEVCLTRCCENYERFYLKHQDYDYLIREKKFDKYKRGCDYDN